jgi:carbamate kinase
MGSPKPLRILDISVIKLLIENSITVICAGGGGIPIIRKANGSLIGVEAVIDKGFSSALLAKEIDAEALIMLTGVEGVFSDWGTDKQAFISQASAREIKEIELPKGSMGPKVLAACQFVSDTGAIAGIGQLTDALKIIEGRAGTLISK